jgi:hypothetical protein
MAAITSRANSHAQTRTSDAVVADTNTVWRLRCRALEDRLQDATAALRRSELERRELSLDYRHVLDRLWKLNAGLTTRRDR